MTVFSRVHVSRLRLNASLLVVLLVLGGCGGGSTYSIDPGTLAQRFLPTVQEIDHHPDSLRALSIQETERGYQLALDETYESLHQKWSCTYRDLGPGRSRRGPSYATFWSLELSLVSLQPEMGLSSLSKEQAQEAIDERRQEYQDLLQFDVYWFETEGRSRLTGPGTRIQLRINEESTYRPSREKQGPLREAFLPGEARTALYRRNTFYFTRVVDGTNILGGARKVELVVNQAGSGPRVQFTWSWENEENASSRLPGSPQGVENSHPLLHAVAQSRARNRKALH